MKQIRNNILRLVPLLTALFVLLGVYGGVSLAVNGGRWFSSSANTYVRRLKKTVTEGSVFDRKGTLLAWSEGEKRLYAADEWTRRGLVHVLGDTEGYVANGVESFMSYYLYGFDQPFSEEAVRYLRGEPKRGDDVHLTVDASLSAYIQQRFPKGYRGCAAVMNYLTGEVLALCSFPSFDPAQGAEQAKGAWGQPFFNRALQGLYAPGSTFKIVTLAAALRNLENAMEREWICTGQLTLNDHLITDAGTDLARQVYVRHGTLDLRRAFAVSCNNTFAMTAVEVGDANLKKTAEDFAVGVNFLFPDLVVENSSYPDKNRTEREIAMTGIGQSALQVTPMHMLLIAASIANDGVMMEPTLLQAVVRPGGDTVRKMESRAFRRTVDAETAAVIRRCMREAVVNGTGSGAGVNGLKVCGKTGSAEIDGQKNTNAWFVGFLEEAGAPYAVCVLVEDAGGGGTAAAPVAGDIFRFLTGNP